MHSQTKLSTLINNLPIELQIFIGEYNVQHRQLTREVLNELTNTGKYKIIRCAFCRKLVTDEDTQQRYGIYVYPWKIPFYCSPECEEVLNHDTLKARRRWLNKLNYL